MIHQGYCLKVYIEGGGAQVNEIAEILGISRQAVNGLYGQTSLVKSYIDAIQKAGHKIPGITASGGMEIVDAEKDRKEIELLKEILKAKDQTIEALSRR